MITCSGGDGSVPDPVPESWTFCKRTSILLTYLQESMKEYIKPPIGNDVYLWTNSWEQQRDPHTPRIAEQLQTLATWPRQIEEREPYWFRWTVVVCRAQLARGKAWLWVGAGSTRLCEDQDSKVSKQFFLIPIFFVLFWNLCWHELLSGVLAQILWIKPLLRQNNRIQTESDGRCLYLCLYVLFTQVDIYIHTFQKSVHASIGIASLKSWLQMCAYILIGMCGRELGATAFACCKSHRNSAVWSTFWSLRRCLSLRTRHRSLWCWQQVRTHRTRTRSL